MTSHPPLRIALAITTLEPGGAEARLTDIALGLDPSRYQPQMLCLAPRPRRDSLVRRLEAASIPVSFLDLTTLLQAPWAAVAVRSWLLEHRPQLVQTFLHHANTLVGFWSQRLGVLHVAGVRVADPRWLRNRLEASVLRGADRIACVSRDVADHVRKTASPPEEKIVVIPNGVDVARFQDATPADLSAHGVAADHRLMLFVGRLDRQKGVSEFIEVAPQLLNALPNWRLAIAGEGPLQSELAAKIAASGASDRIVMLGYRKDVPNLLRRADLVVMPSLWEGMPNVLLEAMAAGRAVACFQAEGVGELLADLQQEQMVELADFHGLRKRASYLCRNHQLRNELGLKNRKRAEAHFCLQTMISAYIQLYEQVQAG